jgi:hypothetical protein
MHRATFPLAFALALVACDAAPTAEPTAEVDGMESLLEAADQDGEVSIFVQFRPSTVGVLNGRDDASDDSDRPWVQGADREIPADRPALNSRIADEGGLDRMGKNTGRVFLGERLVEREIYRPELGVEADLSGRIFTEQPTRTISRFPLADKIFDGTDGEDRMAPRGDRVFVGGPLVQTIDDEGPERIFQGERLVDHQEQAERFLLDSIGRTPRVTFERFGVAVLEVDRTELLVLANDPNVSRITENVPTPTALVAGPQQLRAFEWVDADQRTVAILDTGIDAADGWLNERVVDGACFSTDTAWSTSLCVEDRGAAAATTCDLSIDGCDHGSILADLALEAAPEAHIVAVQVFSEFEGEACDAHGLQSPCALSWQSDQLAAMDHVLGLAEAAR